MSNGYMPFSGDPLRILRARLREFIPKGIIKTIPDKFGRRILTVQVKWREGSKRYRYERAYTEEELLQIRSIQLIYDELADAVRAEVEKIKKSEEG